MKKSDITDEMLVALADGELDEKDASELYALILDDEAALEKFASFAETGALLKVLAKPGLAASGGSNIVSLPNGSTAPRRSLQIRDAFQIAAALLIGIIAGPFIIKQFEAYTSSGRQQVVASNDLAPGGLREIYQIRGRESGALELGIKTSEGDGLTFAGGEFDFDQTFKLVLLSPVSGKVSVFEILGDGQEEVWLSGINIERGQLLEFPSGNDYFSLKPTSKIFSLRVVVSAEGEDLARFFVFSDRP